MRSMVYGTAFSMTFTNR